MIRGRSGKTLLGVSGNEADVLHFFRRRLAAQIALYADEAMSWNVPAARFMLHQFNREEAYSFRDKAQAHTNNAEGFFSCMRRGEIGYHHDVAGPYLIGFAQEAAWRADHKREANGSQVNRILTLAMPNKLSVDFCAHWQRGRAA